ncbi:MAG: hypothetical protein HDT12_04465 [Helicobacter sp.]|nr:hypothetical protein [Helicobacter sp.]
MLKREHRRARCGWDVKIKEQWRIKDCNLQSAAVLWLRHSFARAFSRDSLLGDSMPVDCFGCRLAMTIESYKIPLSVIARGASLVAINRVERS